MAATPLLHEYVQSGSQDVFRRIVEQYINIVYAAARRQVHDQHLAQDVTQAVFFILARKAKSIPQNRPLSAWLLKTTRYAASNAWRLEQRRRQNETRSAIMRQAENAPDDSEQHDLEAMLDDGIDHLNSQDRDALLLRFFEQSSLHEIGSALGISEDAAQKRVSRAVDRLREFFRKRGVTVSAAVLATFLTTRAAEAAPAALATLAASASTTGPIASGTTLSSVMKGALIMTAMEKVKVAAIVTLASILTVAGGVVAVQYTSQASTPAAAAAPPSPSTVPTAAQPLQVKLAGGTVVELLGIQEEKPADPSKWWGPDGLPRPALRYPPNRRNSNNAGARNLRFVFQMIGPAINGKTLHVDIVGASDESSSGEVDLGAFIRQMCVSLPQNLATTKLRFAVSNGPWADELTYDMASGQSTNFTDSSVRMGKITEVNGVTNVELRFPLLHIMVRDEQMVLSVNGQEIPPVGIRRELGVTTFMFGCAKSQVTQAIFRSRPFEWVEMDNVSLVPTNTPTPVQIISAPSPTTAP